MLRAQAGSGPLESKIPANLRANFSSQYLSQKVDGRTRKEVRAMAFHSMHAFISQHL